MSTSDARHRLGRPGDLVDDKFRLEEVVGTGGFGEVWRATQVVEGQAVRQVALKLLAAPGDGGGTPHTGSGGAQAWLNEVRAVREVRSPALVPIFDVGVSRRDRLVYISMELLEGQTLAERLRGGRLYWRRALAIARAVADAMVACHALGVYHCDLKPENIFLSDRGGVHVLDFGIASLASGGPRRTAAELPAEDAFADGTGAVSLDEVPGAAPPPADHDLIGTPGYIAPEQYSGTAPGAASDVYALGVVLYQMIAGALPYRVPDTVRPRASSTADQRASYRAHLATATVRGEQVPLADVAADVPVAVVRAVEAFLEVDPGRRSIDAIADVLDEAWRRPHGVPEPPYVGLDAFDESHIGFIAGRDADVDAIATRLRDHRCVVLAGPSGCGKSSLARAGVAARLDMDLTAGVDGWRTVVVRPAQAAAIEEGGAGSAPDPGLGTVVVVDQLEELLSLDEDERERTARALAVLAEGQGAVTVAGRRLEPDAPVRLVATVRDDLFGRVAALAELRRFPEQNLYTVRGVEPNAVEAIVADPARAAGYELEDLDEVTTEAAEVLGDDPAALPLVQFALTRWWEQRDESRRRLTREAWQRIGGIEGSLGHAAQELYDALDDDRRKRLRTLLPRLFHADGTRARVAEVELVTDATGREVLERLIDRRLVRRQEDDGPAVIEVVHEALGRRWPLLHGWLEETRLEREVVADLERDAAAWRRQDRPVDMLWRGARLDAARRLRDQAGPARDFVDAGLHQAARTRRRRRGLIAAGFAALSGVVILLLFSNAAANRARRAAEAERQRATEAAERAAEGERRAKNVLARLFIDRADESVEAGDLAGAQVYLASALTQRDSPELREKLAHAMSRYPSGAITLWSRRGVGPVALSDRAGILAYVRTPEREVGDGERVAPDAAPDRAPKSVAPAAAPGAVEIALVRLTSGKPIGAIRMPAPPAALDVETSTDASSIRLASVDSDGGVHVGVVELVGGARIDPGVDPIHLDLEQPGSLARIGAVAGRARGVRIQGGMVAAWSDTELAVWEPGSGRRLLLFRPSTPVYEVEPYRPTGGDPLDEPGARFDVQVAGYRDGGERVQGDRSLIRVRYRQYQRDGEVGTRDDGAITVGDTVLAGHVGGTTVTEMLPDRKLLLSGGNDNAVKLWNLRWGVLALEVGALSKPIQTVSMHDDLVVATTLEEIAVWRLARGVMFPSRQVQLSASGDKLLAPIDPSGLAVIDRNSGQEVYRRTGAVEAAAISGDGRLLAWVYPQDAESGPRPYRARIIDPDGGVELADIDLQGRAGHTCAGNQAVWVSGDALTVWQRDTGARTVAGGALAYDALAVADDGVAVLAGGSSPGLWVLRGSQNTRGGFDDGNVRTTKLEGVTDRLTRVATSRGAGLVAGADAAGAVTVWRPSATSPVASFDAGGVPVALAVDDAGEQIAVAVGARVGVWSADGGAIRSFDADRPITHLAFDGEHLLAAGGRGIERWRRDDGRSAGRLRAPGTISALNVADGALVAGTTAGQVRIWPAGANAKPRTLALADARVLAVALVDGVPMSVLEGPRICKGEACESDRGGGDEQLSLVVAAGSRLGVVIEERQQKALGVVRLGTEDSDEVDAWVSDLAATLDDLGGRGELACSPDGRVAVLEREDGDIVVFGPDGVIAEGEQRLATSLAVSGDGELLAFGTGRGTVERWVPATGDSLPSLQVSDQPIACVAFDASGDRVISVDEAGVVAVHDQDGALRFRFDSGLGGTAQCGSEAVMAEGTVWDLRSLERTFTSEPEALREEIERTTGLAVLDDNRAGAIVDHVENARLALVSGDHETAYRELHAARDAGQESPAIRFMLARVAEALRARVARLELDDPVSALAGAGGVIVAGTTEGRLHLIDPADPDPVELGDHRIGIRSLQASADGTRVLSIDRDGGARLWELPGGVELARVPERARLGAIAGARAVVVADRITVWDSATGAALFELDNARGRAEHVALSPGGEHLAVAGRGAIELWSLADGHELATLEDMQDVRAMAFSRDGSQLAVVAGDAVTRYGVSTGEVRGTWPLPEAAPVAFDEAGERIAVSGDASEVLIYDVDSGAVVGHGGGDLGYATMTMRGATVAALDGDRAVRLIGAADGGQGTVVFAARTLDRWDAPSPQLALTAGGRHLATSADGIVEVWDTATVLDPARPVRSLAERSTAGRVDSHLAHQGRAENVFFDHAGTRLVSVGWDDRAVLFRVPPLETVATLPQPGKVVHAAWAPDDSLLITASLGGTARVWDPDTGALLRTYGEHRDRVLRVVFSPDGKRVVSVGKDAVARIWDPRTGKTLLRLTGHTDYILAVHWTADGRHIITGGKDRTARVWNADTGALERVLIGHTDDVTSVDATGDGSVVVTSSNDHSALLWGMWSYPAPYARLAHGAWVNGAELDPTGRRVLTASDDKTARIWDLSGALVHTLVGHVRDVNAAHWSADGRRVVTVGSDGFGAVWDAATATVEWVFRGNETGSDPWLEAALSADGRLLASTGGDGWVHLSRPLSGVPNGHLSWIYAAAPLPGNRVATVGGDGRMVVWSGAGAVLETATRHRLPAVALDVASDGRLASVGWDGFARIAGGPAVEAADALYTLRFSPDGTLLAAGGGHGVLQVWDSHSGAEVATLTGHTASVVSLAWSPDGASLASGDEDGAVRIWDPRAGSARAILEGHDGSVRALRWSPDGTTLYTGDETGMSVWNADSGERRERVHVGSLVTNIDRSDETVAVGSADSTVLWTEGGRRIDLRGARGQFFAGGALLATAGGGRVRVFDTGSGRLVFEQTVRSTAWGAVVATADPRLVTWDDDRVTVRDLSLDDRAPADIAADLERRQVPAESDAGVD